MRQWFRWASRETRPTNPLSHHHAIKNPINTNATNTTNTHTTPVTPTPQPLLLLLPHTHWTPHHQVCTQAPIRVPAGPSMDAKYRTSPKQRGGNFRRTNRLKPWPVHCPNWLSATSPYRRLADRRRCSTRPFPFERLTLGLAFCKETLHSSLQRSLRRIHQLRRGHPRVVGLLEARQFLYCVVDGCARPGLPEIHDCPPQINHLGACNDAAQRSAFLKICSENVWVRYGGVFWVPDTSVSPEKPHKEQNKIFSIYWTQNSI